MKNKNVIPRNFNRITARALIDITGCKKGDILHIFKNDFGLLSLNTATGKYYYLPFATARNENIFTFIETI